MNLTPLFYIHFQTIYCIFQTKLCIYFFFIFWLCCGNLFDATIRWQDGKINLCKREPKTVSSFHCKTKEQPTYPLCKTRTRTNFWITATTLRREQRVSPLICIPCTSCFSHLSLFFNNSIVEVEIKVLKPRPFIEL